MLWLANAAFFVFHTALILFNVFGWIPRRTRRWNLLSLLLTLLSWTVMGLWYGMGFCFCTEWHWQVRRAMGIHDSASSYLALLVQKLTGWSPPTQLLNRVALWVFVACLLASVALNARDWLAERRTNAPA